jgi:hypothetical protein
MSEKYLVIEAHESEMVVTVHEKPTPRGPVEWTPDLEARADRIARVVLSDGEPLLVPDVEVKIERPEFGTVRRRYRRPVLGGWHRI